MSEYQGLGIVAALRASCLGSHFLRQPEAVFHT